MNHRCWRFRPRRLPGDPARVYLREMRRYPLLTREQEIDLARRMERASARILRTVSRLRLTEQLLIETADCGSFRADPRIRGAVGLGRS